ncbi:MULTISPECIES: DUF4135 domain-containing protein [Nocardia]|uniref:DUF4135 domain-containing protein n=1 Tax=Nocardia abscessus TaxID=120957 RepID=UPI00189497A6|nr:DUF4135 domain-containing protein [Nocardia abscessus]MBF6475465.1 DUF4135 domain-containing protein [Nocardia abscessus]
MPEYLDLHHVKRDVMRYLIPQVAIAAQCAGLRVTHSNSEVLGSLSEQVMAGSSAVWDLIVAPRLAETLAAAVALHDEVSECVRESAIVRPAVGDPHGGGRTATEITTEHGVQYFKPNRVSKRQLLEDFTNVTNLSECFVAPSDRCWSDGYVQDGIDFSISPVDREEFWFRAGQFAAGAEMLSITDLHYENIATTGGKVAVIDDETVLTTALALRPRSILTTLLLQDPAQARIGVVAGLMADHTTGMSRNFPRITEPTDGGELSVGFIGESRRSPTAIGARYGSICAHEDSFIDGLRSGYDHIRAHRTAAVEVIASHARSLRSRVIVDATANYRRLSAMVATSPPDITIADLEDRLAGELHAIGRPYVTDAVIRSEARQLAAGDVPMFMIDTASERVRDQWSPVAKVVRSPAAVSISAITGLGPDHVGRQCVMAREYIGRLRRMRQEGQ